MSIITPKGLDLGIRWLAVAGAAVIFVWLLGPGWEDGFPVVFPDTASYFAVADRGPWHPKFWYDQRPPGYPLFVWALFVNPLAIVVGQTLVWFVAWGWLISTAWRRLENRYMRVATVVILVGVAVEQRWLMWTTQLLSEALSGTLAVAMVAAWWNLWCEQRRYRLWVAVTVTAWWMLVRDSNAFTLLGTAVPMVVFVFWWWKHNSQAELPHAILMLLLATIMVGGYALMSQSLSGRGHETFHNNVGLRWLPDNSMQKFFVERGMPLDDALLERSGGDAWADGEAFLRDQRLTEYRGWAVSAGRRSFAESLILKSNWYLDRLNQDLKALTAIDYEDYNTNHVGSPLPDRPIGWFDPTNSRTSMYLSVVVWLIAAGSALVARRSDTVWFALIITVPVLTDMYISFSADAVEVGRHLTGSFLRYSVVVAIASAVMFDSIGRSSTPDKATVDGVQHA